MTPQTTESVLEPQLQTDRKPVSRFHPGWVMLGVAAAGIYMSAPGQSYSVAAFIDPMLTDLNLHRTEFSAAYLVATLIGGLTLPWIGRLLDAWGARRMLPIVALLLGLACVWMSSIRTVVGLYIGFSLIRCLGQGSLTLISTWMIGEWFERRRGLATGLLGLGGTLSVMSVPQINDFLITEYGWRNSWMILAAVVAGVLVLPGMLLIRNRPEDMGLLPDGGFPTDSRHTYADPANPATPVVAADLHSKHPMVTDESWTVSESIRSPTFWKLLSVVAACSLVGTGLVFHQVSLLAEHGVSRVDALRLMAVQAFVGTISSVVAGYLTDRIQARYLLFGSMLFLSLALLLLIVMPSPGWSVVYAALLGLQGGIIRSTGTVVWINYYGRLYQGAVRGFAMSFMVIAAAFGPLPLALAKDHLGDYNRCLIGFLILPLLAGVGVLTAAPPVKNQ